MATWRFLYFFLIAIAVWSGVFFYMGSRFIGPSGLVSPWRSLAWGGLAIASFLGPVILFSARISPKPSWYPIAITIGFSTMGVMLTIFPLLAFKDVGLLLIIVATKIRSIFFPDSVGLSVNFTRRQFVSNLLNLGVIASGVTFAAFGNATARRHLPSIVRVSVPFAELPEAFDQYRIAHISDVHLGSTIMGRERLQSVVEAVNEEKPDLIAFTGDIADGYAQELSFAATPFAELKAPDGKYYVTGNHDYYWDPRGWIAEVERLGFVILMNEHRIVRRGEAELVLAGVPDVSAASMIPEHVSNPEVAVRGVPKHLIKILLAHQPRSHTDADRAGFHLQLSGHTHGGQFWPWTWLIHLAQPFVAGLHRFNKMWVYVNRGTGTWGPPIRSGLPGEITLLTLRRTS